VADSITEKSRLNLIFFSVDILTNITPKANNDACDIVKDNNYFMSFSKCVTTA
jgi:hypothetical protein